MAVKFVLGLNNSYNEFRSFYTNGLKPWPDCLETAYQDAAKYNPRRAASNSPAAMERANAFAMTGRGGRGGRGGYPGGHNGKSAPNARWVTDGADSPEGGKSDRGSPIGAYTANKSPPAGTDEAPVTTAGSTATLRQSAEGNPRTSMCSTGRIPV